MSAAVNAPAGPAPSSAPAPGAPPGGASPGALAFSGGPPGEGGAPPPAPFANVLNAQVARTASAEGQSKTATQTGGKAKTNNSSDQDTAALAAALAAAVTAAPTAAPSVPAAGQDPSEGDALPGPASATAAAPTAEAPTAEAPTAEAPSADVRAELQQAFGAAPTAPSAATDPSTPAGQLTALNATVQSTPDRGPGATPPQPFTDPSTAAPQTIAAVSPTIATSLSTVQASPAAHPAPARASVTDATGDTTATPAGAAATANAASAAAGQGASGQGTARDGGHGDPATPGQSAALDASASAAAGAARMNTPAAVALPTVPAPVPLAHAAQVVSETIALASRQGATEAHIQLAPEALGQIDIHLRHTADGVVAHVIAGPEAAQRFQQGADDLRRSLQQQGVNLVGLHIATSDGRDAGAQSQAQAAAARRSARADRSAGDQDAAIDSPSATTTLEPLNGASISVLA